MVGVLPSMVGVPQVHVVEHTDAGEADADPPPAGLAAGDVWPLLLSEAAAQTLRELELAARGPFLRLVGHLSRLRSGRWQEPEGGPVSLHDVHVGAVGEWAVVWKVDVGHEGMALLVLHLVESLPEARPPPPPPSNLDLDLDLKTQKTQIQNSKLETQNPKPKSGRPKPTIAQLARA